MTKRQFIEKYEYKFDKLRFYSKTPKLFLVKKATKDSLNTV